MLADIKKNQVTIDNSATSIERVEVDGKMLKEKVETLDNKIDAMRKDILDMLKQIVKWFIFNF